MALKMIALSATDKQFIDDNMLTDEDFHFDAEELEVSYEDKTILESLANELQLNSGKISMGPLAAAEQQTADLASDLDALLRKYGYDIELKAEPASPNSSDVSSEIYSSDRTSVLCQNDVSVINIPEIITNCEQTGLMSDTPPHTPPGMIDMPGSPLSCTNIEPIMVSVTSSSNLSYAVPCTTQAANPVKYKLNIQPKPEATKGNNVAMSGDSTVNSEHIVKIANRTLKIKAPVNVAFAVPNASNNISRSAKTQSSKLPVKNGRNGVSETDLVEICEAALKRQERIIKNRESAYQSRKRKKEYVQKLEAELHQITAENTSLREENSMLKLKISNLENELLKLKSTFSPKRMKKTVCFMVVLFMVTFNLGPYSLIFDKVNMKPLQANFESHRRGRVLLWDVANNTDENETESIYSKLNYVEDEINAAYVVGMEKTYNFSSCQTFINKTESLRLENDLLGWVKRVEKKQKQTASSQQKGVSEMKMSLANSPKLQTWLRHKMDNQKDIWAKHKNRHEILIYQTPRKAYEDFFDAIHRRDDTFYFVSFSGDHLLLPATAHNQTLRPRMSFVMPAMTLNESVGDTDEHISMMQIDCEVMDTKLVYIKESVIPPHLRQKQNNTEKPNSRNSPKYSVNRNSRFRSPVAKLSHQSGTD